MAYTVKQLASMAGVSRRTLHYYDEIGLLPPSRLGSNGYRYYEDEALLRLQQILFFRELDFSLDQISEILDRPEFNTLEALQAHKKALQQRARRLNELINTIERTMQFLQGQGSLEGSEMFAGFDEEKEKLYEQEARRRYGDANVQAASDRWRSYPPEQKARIRVEGEAIYRDILAHMDEGADSPAVQDAIARWHNSIRYFYEPTVEILRGLGQMYVEDPQFAAVYEQMHSDMPGFLRQAIEHYCGTLE